MWPLNTYGREIGKANIKVATLAASAEGSLQSELGTVLNWVIYDKKRGGRSKINTPALILGREYRLRWLRGPEG